MRKAAASAPEQGSLKERSILIVDYDHDVVELLAGLLDEEGYRVRVAFNEAAALRETAREPPDLVVRADLTADRELTNRRLPNLFHPFAGVETAVEGIGHQIATGVAGMIERAAERLRLKAALIWSAIGRFVMTRSLPSSVRSRVGLLS
jgi:ActR/RegA family two-component response regulator